MFALDLATFVFTLYATSVATSYHQGPLTLSEILTNHPQCRTRCSLVVSELQCDTISCYCGTDNLQSFADCYVCLTPIVQKEDPTWPTRMRQSLEDIVSACRDLEFPVQSPTFGDSAVLSTGVEFESDPSIHMDDEEPGEFYYFDLEEFSQWSLDKLTDWEQETI